MTPPTPEEVEALRRFVRTKAATCDVCGGLATVELVTHDAGEVACDRPECRARGECGRCGGLSYALDECHTCGVNLTVLTAEVRDLHDAVAVRWAVRP